MRSSTDRDSGARRRAPIAASAKNPIVLTMRRRRPSDGSAPDDPLDDVGSERAAGVPDGAEDLREVTDPVVARSEAQPAHGEEHGYRDELRPAEPASERAGREGEDERVRRELMADGQWPG